MLRLGQKVYIVVDSFEQNLPVGDYGYIIAYDRNPDNAFNYVLRIPRLGKHLCVPASDIQPEEILIQHEVDRVEKEALIDYALATKNEELFFRIMNGDPIDASPVESQEKMNQDDFIKQVNLKAWI
jgi:hypothetical protein